MTTSPLSSAMLGLYLIPPPAVVVPFSQAHVVLEREFGATAAGRFMVHVTVKGFFKPKPGADIERLVGELDRAYARRAAFSVTLGTPSLFQSERGTSVLVGLEQSEALRDVQQATWRVIEPYVAADCPFTPGERPETTFWQHLTLVQYDLPADPILQEQALELCRHIRGSLPAQSWIARDLQLIQFDSEDWLGRWWDTLRYHQRKGWRLDPPEADDGRSAPPDG